MRDQIVESVINRYYDPATDQLLSIDPDVAQTGQPYVFTNDDPLNAEDPLGLCSWYDVVCDVIHHTLTVILVVAVAASVVATGGADAGLVGLALSVEEGSTADAVFGAVDTIARTASYASAGLDTTQCAMSHTVGACGAAVLSLATAGVSYGSSKAEAEAVADGLKAIGATLGSGSTVVDVSVSVSSSGKVTVKPVTKKKK